MSSPLSHPHPLSSIQNALSDMESPSITTDTSTTIASPSVPHAPSRPRRIVPPDIARTTPEGFEYTEWGDIAWKLFGKPDGTADFSTYNEELTEEEIKKLEARMLASYNLFLVANCNY
jgi:hypothetical protein